MVLNYLWIAFFLIAIIIGFIKLIFFGDTEIFKLMAEGTFDSAKASVMDIALPLVGIMSLWLGFMRIGEKAGAINFLSNIVGPFFNRLFPEVPKNHPAVGQMMMNFSANLLGLDNAATPLGLKAMNSLQEINNEKEVASNAQIMFMVLHASGLTILPIAIIAQRAIFHSKDPTDIFIPCIVATFASTITGLIVVSIKQKINLFDKVILSWLVGITGFIVLMVWGMSRLDHHQVGNFSKVFSNIIYLIIPSIFILGGLFKKINVFEAFIEGAKEGFEVSIKIIPYLVGLLVAVSLFRTSGALNYLGEAFACFFGFFNIDLRFTKVLPIAFLRPLSGSGARALMLDNLKVYGPDSLLGHMSSVLYGTADTAFYIVALYFGAINIKKTRYAIPAMLISDLVGIITAIFISYLFFG